MKIYSVAGLLGVALLAFFVTPTQSVPVPEPSSDLVNLQVFVGVDLSGLGELLNALLGLVLGLVSATVCEYEGIATQIEGLVAEINVYLAVDILGIDVRASLLVLLGPLLQAVGELVAALLGGLSINLSIVINLILNLLVTLNLNLDAAVAVQLGNLLNLDVLAIVQLG